MVRRKIMKANKNLTSLGQFIDKEYGVKGTTKRDKLDAEYEAYKLGVLIQQSRQEKDRPGK
jgi:HTH-type transcriptional regulator / antitoxin HipB